MEKFYNRVDTAEKKKKSEIQELKPKNFIWSSHQRDIDVMNREKQWEDMGDLGIRSYYI